MVDQIVVRVPGRYRRNGVAAVTQVGRVGRIVPAGGDPGLQGAPLGVVGRQRKGQDVTAGAAVDIAAVGAGDVAAVPDAFERRILQVDPKGKAVEVFPGKVAGVDG